MRESSKRIGKIITKISTSSRSKKVSVYFGNEKIEISPDTYSDYYLYVGKEMSEKEYKDLLFKIKQDDLYKYGLSLAVKYCYSTFEVITKLKNKANEDQSVAFVITRLKKAGLLDDEEFAKEYKETKEIELYGEERIKEDLLHKKLIDPSIVNKLKFKNEYEHAKTVAEQIEKKLDRYPYNAKMQKALEALRRRGFTYEVSSKAISGYKMHRKEDNKLLNKIGETLLKQYSRKYSGYELRKHMFAALARRGYEIDDINNYLEEVL